MKVNKILIVHPIDNPNVGVYHFDFPIPNVGQSGNSMLANGWLMWGPNRSEEKDEDLSTALAQIEGVINLHTGHRYVLTVTKATLFDWQDIDPLVVRAVCCFTDKYPENVHIETRMSCQEVEPNED